MQMPHHCTGEGGEAQRERAARQCGPLSVQDLAFSKEAAPAVGTSPPHPYVPTQMDGLGGCLPITPSYCEGKWENTHAHMRYCYHQWGSWAMPVCVHACARVRAPAGQPTPVGTTGACSCPTQGPGPASACSAFVCCCGGRSIAGHTLLYTLAQARVGRT